MSTGLWESLVSMEKRIQSARSLLRVRDVSARVCPSNNWDCWRALWGRVMIRMYWESLLNQASIRRFIFTLITGYLAIFGVQQIPYEFPNQWAVLIPVLIVVYIITVWLDGVFFKDEQVEQSSTISKKSKTKISKRKSTGFGDSWIISSDIALIILLLAHLEVFFRWKNR